MLAESTIPAWQPHPEVWLLVAGLIALGCYTSRVIEPTVVAKGGRPITRAQRWWFVGAVLLLWFASDWPIHDISEERLYSVHMFQHLLYSVVIPPMLLLATPEWLGRLIIGQGRLLHWFRKLARPLPAAVGYNVVVAFTHWPWAVNTSIQNGPFHYSLHVLVVFTALLAWVPVCGPFPEMRATAPVQMIHIFLLSVIPTIPAAWLTASEGVLYKGYDHGPRMWGLSVIDDQQFAGVTMKIIGGFYLWTLIIVIFFRWVRAERGPESQFRGKLVLSDAARAAQAAAAEAGEPAAEPGVEGAAGRLPEPAFSGGPGPSGSATPPGAAAPPPTPPAPPTTQRGSADRG
jgi:putative membrane protein